MVKTLNQRVRDRYTYPYLSCPWLQTFLCISLRRHAHRPLAKRLMHTGHLAGNTSGVSKSSSNCVDYTGFPGDECVVFFNVPLGNKNAVLPNLPHERRKPPCLQLMTSACHACLDQLNAGFSKVCGKKNNLRHIIFKVCQSFTRGDISTPLTIFFFKNVHKYFKNIKLTTITTLQQVKK